ncbi:hypothetical protein ACT3XG_14810 [Paenibacillus polymyxa]|uniref:hypothetical protein n=1 Tax=Paenibacillus TaxID=44249 RepID=UPI00142D8FBD|nr:MULTISPECIES: hypothetical protein [Paenibacillus]KAF6658894.1 hypothetical protein HFD99_01385 [Paenibacillus sp. EKM301P]UBS85427.1 hypothetical protein LAZ93_14765 [Paenibacillus polymyxa]WHX33946.1 hypothetical protein QNH38_15245 [Paenibacillus polymyxa]
MRCFKSGQYITAGKRYEIIGEVDGLFVFLDDDGDEHCWSIEPGEEGESYRDHFVLETDEKLTPTSPYFPTNTSTASNVNTAKLNGKQSRVNALKS